MISEICSVGLSALRRSCRSPCPGAQAPLRDQRAGINVDFTVDGVRKEVRRLPAPMRGDDGVHVLVNAEKLVQAMERRGGTHAA
jgi:hypothetical protein